MKCRGIYEYYSTWVKETLNENNRISRRCTCSIVAR